MILHPSAPQLSHVLFCWDHTSTLFHHRAPALSPERSWTFLSLTHSKLSMAPQYQKQKAKGAPSHLIHPTWYSSPAKPRPCWSLFQGSQMLPPSRDLYHQLNSYHNNSAIPILGIYTHSWVMNTHVHTKTCTHMFTVAMFATLKKWK